MSFDQNIKLKVRHPQGFSVIDIPSQTDVRTLKARLADLTRIPVLQQQLTGLSTLKRNVRDSDTLKSLRIKSGLEIQVTDRGPVEVIDVDTEPSADQRRVQEQQDRVAAYMEQIRLEREARHVAWLQQQQQREGFVAGAWSPPPESNADAFLSLALPAQPITPAQMDLDTTGELRHHRLEVGDKILLPHSVLADAMNRRLALPLCFRLSSRLTQEVVHAGVAEFHEEGDVAFLPQWMLEKLGLEAGWEVQGTTVKLPRGEMLQLESLSPLWARVPDPRALLEEQLRTYQCLSVGDRITVQHQHKDLALRVAQLSPAPAVSLIDVDVNLEILPVPDDSAALALETKVAGDVAPDQYAYYKIDELAAGKWTVLVEAVKGDPDLVVDTRPRPTIEEGEGTWFSELHGDDQITLELETSVERKAGLWNYGPEPTPIWIGVRGFEGAAEFRLSVSAASGQVLGSSGASTAQCSNCRQPVPAQSLQMHEMQCARRNVRCGVCGQVLRTEQMGKHQTHAHRVTECSCGRLLEQQMLSFHRQHECAYRLQPCIYCGLRLTAAERPSHQGICGNRTSTCGQCQQSMKRNLMAAHFYNLHGRPNPRPLVDYF